MPLWEKVGLSTSREQCSQELGLKLQLAWIQDPAPLLTVPFLADYSISLYPSFLIH